MKPGPWGGYLGSKEHFEIMYAYEGWHRISYPLAKDLGITVYITTLVRCESKKFYLRVKLQIVWFFRKILEKEQK